MSRFANVLRSYNFRLKKFLRYNGGIDDLNNIYNLFFGTINCALADALLDCYLSKQL